MASRIQQLKSLEFTDSPSKQLFQEWMAALEEEEVEDGEIRDDTDPSHNVTDDQGRAKAALAQPVTLNVVDYNFNVAGRGHQFVLPFPHTRSAGDHLSDVQEKMEPDLEIDSRFGFYVGKTGDRRKIFSSEPVINPFIVQRPSGLGNGGLDRGCGGLPVAQPDMSVSDLADAFLQKLGQSVGHDGAKNVEEELMSMATQAGIMPTLDVATLGSSWVSASLDIGNVRLSVPGPFKNQAEARMTVCREGIYLLKSKISTLLEPKHEVETSAAFDSTNLKNGEAAGHVCSELNMETNWIGLLKTFALKQKLGAVKFHHHQGLCHNHTMALPPHGYDVVVNTKRYSCPDYYHASSTAKVAAAKYTAKELYTSGAPIDIPNCVMSQVQWKRGIISWNLVPVQEAPRRKKGPKDNERVSKQDPAPKRNLPPSQGDQFQSLKFAPMGPSASKSNLIPLTRLRIQQPTEEEISARSRLSQGREPESLDSMLGKINGLCDGFQIKHPIYEIVADDLGGTAFSGAAVFQAHPLIANTRVGEILHVYGKLRAKELCAIGVLSFLEAFTAVGSSTGSQNKKRAADDEVEHTGRKVKIERREQIVELTRAQRWDVDLKT